MKGGLLRFFSLGVIDQALLSLTNFMVGLLMLRRTDDVDYGLFVLATSTFLLLVGVQNSVVCGPAAVIATKKAAPARLAMIGTLMTRQFVYWIPVCGFVLIGFWLAGELGYLESLQQRVGMIGAVAVLGVLLREFARELWLLYGHPRQLLWFDAAYAVVYLGAAYVLTGLAAPAVPWVLAGLGAAALVAGLSSWLAFRRLEGWPSSPYPGAMQEAWRLGRWGLSGCVVTWLHAQGFYYVVTALRGVESVSGLAAARLLLMPVNLMVNGVGQLLLPLATQWLSTQGARAMAQRIMALSMVMLVGTLGYFVVLWLTRDWLIAEVLKRDGVGMDPILLLWGGVFGLMSLRAMAMVVLQALERFDSLTYLAVLSAAVSLLVGYFGILRFDAPGALIGLIVGEAIDLIGILWLSVREVRSTKLDIAGRLS